MAKLDLSVLDIRSLIDAYTSDLRKLDYQAHAIKANIDALEDLLGKTASARDKKESSKIESPAKKQKAILETASVNGESTAKQSKVKEEKGPKKGPGRPRLIPLEDIKVEPFQKVEKPKKVKEPKAAKAKKEAGAGNGKRGRIPGFNKWEEGILSVLRDANRPLKNDDFMPIMKAIAERDNVQEGPAQLKVRLNQALVKLGNKLGLLDKQNFDGKGYLYSLK
ncbi:hypothetical protein [Haliscomenobacter sp.]|uniref:hypothetical protein n=1 Tax=Haliscomenobacter sp. TaxID=2717303 RepID=UPI003364C779